MSGYSFDSNIIIDALLGYEEARTEIRRATEHGNRPWISRMVWIEIMSKGQGERLRSAEILLSGFGMDEIDAEISERAASLRRERSRLKTPDAIILASALVRGRILVTRNSKDFPVEMPGIRIPYTL